MVKIAPKLGSARVMTKTISQKIKSLPVRSRAKNIWRRVRWGRGRIEELSPQDIAREKREAKSGAFPLIDIKVRHRILAILAYFQILLVVPLFLGRRDGYVRYHVKQGVALLIVWAFVPFLFWLPLVGWFGLIFLLFELLWGVVSAARGRESSLPLVARLVV